jgi:hypothetical protein
MDSIELTASQFKEWSKDYYYNAALNEYCFKGFEAIYKKMVDDWISGIVFA